MMPGPAPKMPEQRRDRHPKMRGEWIEIPPANDEPVPPLPDRAGGWCVRTRQAWEAWWCDPASTQWTGADIENVQMLAELYENARANGVLPGERGTIAALAEMRLRMDALGLTQKGKRDFRWRVARDEEITTSSHPAASATSARRDRLKVV